LSDPLATRLLTENDDVLAPFITVLLNRSLSSGSVPTTFNDAYITPLVKKANMDPADERLYNRSRIYRSKLLERLVAKQLME